MFKSAAAGMKSVAAAAKDTVVSAKDGAMGGLQKVGEVVHKQNQQTKARRGDAAAAPPPHGGPLQLAVTQTAEAQPKASKTKTRPKTRRRSGWRTSRTGLRT